jgi:hypothetical protein
VTRAIFIIFFPDWTVEAILLQADTEGEEIPLRALADRILKALEIGEK